MPSVRVCSVHRAVSALRARTASRVLANVRQRSGARGWPSVCQDVLGLRRRLRMPGLLAQQAVLPRMPPQHVSLPRMQVAPRGRVVRQVRALHPRGLR
jgi:hypothetical protein